MVQLTNNSAPTKPVAAQVVTQVGAGGATDRIVVNPAIGSGDAETAQGIGDNPYEFTQYGDLLLAYMNLLKNKTVTGSGKIRGYGDDGNRYQI